MDAHHTRDTAGTVKPARVVSGRPVVGPPKRSCLTAGALATAAGLAAAVSLSALALIAGAPPSPGTEIPGAEISLPEDQVTDRFYGYLIGLVDANTCGVVDGRQLHKVLRDHLGKTSIPFETIEEIKRECSPGSSVRDVTITFTADLETPVPYSILGYHPGSVAASQNVKFLEWYMPSQKISVSNHETLELSQVFIFGIYEGWAVVDIDAWVDRILGGFLDDTRIVTMVLFKYKGDWHGLAAGYGRSGEGRSGIFNFHTNKILFPTPRELRVLAPYFRNFVVRTKRLESPVPPGDRWKSARK